MSTITYETAAAIYHQFGECRICSAAGVVSLAVAGDRCAACAAVEDPSEAPPTYIAPPEVAPTLRPVLALAGVEVVAQQGATGTYQGPEAAREGVDWLVRELQALQGQGADPEDVAAVLHGLLSGDIE